jgi:hypothetical protein
MHNRFVDLVVGEDAADAPCRAGGVERDRQHSPPVTGFDHRGVCRHLVGNGGTKRGPFRFTMVEPVT